MKISSIQCWHQTSHEGLGCLWVWDAVAGGREMFWLQSGEAGVYGAGNHTCAWRSATTCAWTSSVASSVAEASPRRRARPPPRSSPASSSSSRAGTRAARRRARRRRRAGTRTSRESRGREIGGREGAAADALRARRTAARGGECGSAAQRAAKTRQLAAALLRPRFLRRFFLQRSESSHAVAPPRAPAPAVHGHGDHVR